MADKMHKAFWDRKEKVLVQPSGNVALIPPQYVTEEAQEILNGAHADKLEENA